MTAPDADDQSIRWRRHRLSLPLRVYAPQDDYAPRSLRASARCLPPPARCWLFTRRLFYALAGERKERY